MSITVTTDIFCDGDGCSQWTPGVSGIRTDKQCAKELAKEAGWTITSRRDLCPACARKEAANGH